MSVSFPKFSSLSVLSLSIALASSLQAVDLKDDALVEQIVITPEMLSDRSMTAGFFDEQSTGENPEMLGANTPWDPEGKGPYRFVIDLGSEQHLGKIMFWDLHGHGDIVVSAGAGNDWTQLLVEDGVGMRRWKTFDGLNVRTRYLKVEKESAVGSFGEMLVYAYTAEGSQLRQAATEKAAREAALIEEAKAEAARRPEVDSGTLFGHLPLVDEIKPGQDTSRPLVEYPEGVSRVETILGKPVRVLPNEGEDSKYFAYKVGEGKYLEPGKAYLLTVEFPDDAPRSFHVSNRGADMVRGIQTGKALGDTILGYTSTNLESLEIPLSNQYQTFQQLFWLNHRYDDIQYNRTVSEAKRTFTPTSGFDVIVAQPKAVQAPLSQGAAIARIRLFEVPNPERFNAPINFPKGLPRRHLFYREEMADGVLNSKNPDERAVKNPTDWFVYHMRLMNFLGMNTYAKDLLEFGAPQHWDVENPSWYAPHKFPHVWGELVAAATAHGLELLPYYEYAGSTGRSGRAQLADEHVIPLKNDHYTHSTWIEKRQADLTDPDTWTEFKHVLDLTILKFKDKGQFSGVWLRPRHSQMPMSFSDSTLARFAADTGHAVQTRTDLHDNDALLQAYYDWWFGKRKEFLLKIRDYLVENDIGGMDDEADVLFMALPREPVNDITERIGWRPLITDDTALWEQIAQENEDYRFVVFDVEEVAEKHIYKDVLLSPLRTWGNWEWNHAAPQADPHNYQDTENVLLTYPFNRMFTLNDTTALDAFRTPAGLAMVRHFPLNETTMDEILGYFVTDYERIGTYQMMPEAMAVANGDPFYIGYTSSHIFNRGFPSYARRFNANYLALPALPSVVVEGATRETGVVVREIKTEGQGTYLAIVNTNLEPVSGVRVQLPDSGRVVAAATGEVLSQASSFITVDLDAFELRSLHIQ